MYVYSVMDSSQAQGGTVLEVTVVVTGPLKGDASRKNVTAHLVC